MVLGQRGRPPGGDHGVEVEVGRPSVGRGQFGPVEGERGAQLHEGEDLATGHVDARAAASVDGCRCARHRRPSSSQPSGPVKSTSRRAARKCFNERVASSSIWVQALVGDRGQLSHQMVHGNVLLSFRRLPMPRLSVRPSTASPGPGDWVWVARRGSGCCGRCGRRARPDRGCPAPPPPRRTRCRPGWTVTLHPVAERPERLVEEGVGQDAVDLGADLGPDLELGGVGLGGPPASRTWPAGDAEGEGHGVGGRLPQPVADLVVEGLRPPRA